MYDIKIMTKLKPSYNRSLIYTRLGYDKKRTGLSASVKDETEWLIDHAGDILDITAAYLIMGIDRVESPRVILEDGTELEGEKLSELLCKCDQALLMFATGGRKIMELINRLQAEGRMSEAVVIDAAASEITDSALDFVMAHVEQQLRPRGRMLTKMRYSPGYGDFDITQQRDFYRLLKGFDFGIQLNEVCLLLPEKSVYAIAGICGTLA